MEALDLEDSPRWRSRGCEWLALWYDPWISRCMTLSCSLSCRWALISWSTSGSLISSNHGSARHSTAESLFVGSSSNVPFSIWRASGDILPRYLLSSVSGFVISGNFKPTNLGFLLKSSYCWGIRGPSIFWMQKSWSISDSPGKSASPSVISPIMHPIAQMSTSFP